MSFFKLTKQRFTSSFKSLVFLLLWVNLAQPYLIQAEQKDSEFNSDENLFNAQVPLSSIELALSDSDHLIRPEFQAPEALRPTVKFWMRIYTEFSTQQVVISDSKHPDVIYEVLDFRNLAKTARGPIIYELTVKKKVNAAISRYNQAFYYLSMHPNANSIRGKPSLELQNIRKALKFLPHQHSILNYAKNLRAQTGQRDNIVKGLAAAEPFFPKMEEIFRNIGIPPELTRLSLVESSFNLEAKSRVGAAGIWQFMRNPGGKFLLISNEDRIDERLSPLKSTVAAARLLKENFQRFKSWPLSVTAYNHGLRGLTKIRRTDSAHFKKIAHLFQHCGKGSPLGWAAQNYYSEFLAVFYAEKYKEIFYGIPPSKELPSIEYHRLVKATSLQALAKNFGTSLQELQKLNPDLQKKANILPKGFLIAAPSKAHNLKQLLMSRRAARTRMLAENKSD